jgi:MinD superfamily P-loop ATPase
VKQLVVLSGKGGTGKTSVVASLAQLAAREEGSVVTADCDVEASNLSILLPGAERTTDPFFSGRRAVVDPDLCTGCFECFDRCRFDAIEMNGIAHVDQLACEGCGVCALVCPEGAVGFGANQAGWIAESSTRMGPLIHAGLGVAQDRSGKLVAEVRSRARAAAGRDGTELIFIDGPPGIGCPVHAALTGCDRVLAVTEPTPSGEHDLRRLLELVDHFRLPAAVLINKHDLAPELTTRIETMARHFDTPVVGRLPFDPAVPRALARGELPLQVASLAGPLETAWETLKGLMGHGFPPGQPDDHPCGTG